MPSLFSVHLLHRVCTQPKAPSGRGLSKIYLIFDWEREKIETRSPSVNFPFYNRKLTAPSQRELWALPRHSSPLHKKIVKSREKCYDATTTNSREAIYGLCKGIPAAA